MANDDTTTHDAGEDVAARGLAPPRPAPRFIDLRLALALLAGTFLLYVPSLFSQFIDYDDPEYVTQNEHVKQGLSWANVKWAFTTDYFSNYLPVTWLSHMLDVQVWGLNAGGHHATSSLLHALNAALAYLFLRFATGARWRSLVVAVLFAVHPLRVESVCWIAERKDVLAATFFLLMLLAYVRYVRRPSWRWYVLALLLDALGLLSKTMLVTVPGVLLLLDFWPLRRMPFAPPATDDEANSAPRRGIGWLLAEKVPFVVLSIIASLWTIALQREGGALDAGRNLSLGQRLANAAVSVPRYLEKTIRPTDLSTFYPHPGHWPAWQVGLSAAFVLGVSAAAVWQLRRRPWMAVGWFWFCGMLVPVSGIVQAGSQSMADRYTYLPSIGLLAAAVWGAAELLARAPQARKAAGPVTAVFVVVLAVLTILQQRYWKNTIELFEHALIVNEKDYLAQNMVGIVYQSDGDDARAMEHFERSIELNPNQTDVRHNYAISLRRQGRNAEAMRQYREAARVAPRAFLTRAKLGIALSQAGDFRGAVEELSVAIRLAPNEPHLRAQLGAALMALGRRDEAVAAFDEALRIDPNLELVRKAREQILQLPASRPTTTTRPTLRQ